MAIDLFFVREKALAKQIVVQHTPEWTDILTKLLSPTRLFFLGSKLKVAELPIVSHAP